jgi:hypothetical protein
MKLEVVLGNNTISRESWHGFLSEGVDATHGVQGRVVCSWAEEELDISFHHSR